MIPVYVLLGLVGAVGSLAFIFLYVVPHINGRKVARQIRLTIPQFDWRVKKQDNYPYHTIFYFAGVAAHFETQKGTAANGIYGYTKFTLVGMGTDDEYEMKFKMGQNVFLLWTEWNRFLNMVRDSGGEVFCSHGMGKGLQDLKKMIDNTNNLKVIEQNEKPK